MESNAADDVHLQSEVESVNCECCGFTEECTLPYISQIRKHYNGRWICGLCMEAVKYQILRSDNVISTQEAMNRHADFYEDFRSSSKLTISEEENEETLGFSERLPVSSDQFNSGFTDRGYIKEKHCVDEEVVSVRR